MKRKRRDLICRIIQTAVYIYIMYAGLWCICKLMGVILRGLGVG